MKAKKIWTALAMAGLLMAGCQSAPSGGEGGTTPAPSATLAGSPAPVPVASSASGEDALKAMREAMNKATSWRATTVMGGKVNNVLDNVCPDKSRMVSGTGSMTSETIRIGPDTYSKVGKYNWVKTATSKGMRLECGPGRVKEPPASLKWKVTKGGTATVNGESCQEWTTSIGGEPLLTTTACVGSDNLLRQMKMGDVTVTYSNWNKPATIEAPK